MSAEAAFSFSHEVREPKGLSPRLAWLRDYYFQGNERVWNNEFSAYTTGAPWDVVFDEMTWYVAPEIYPFLPTFSASFLQAAREAPLNDAFWSKSLPERRAWFIREVMVNQLPQEILPGDLLAGTRFNLQASRCFSRMEAWTWHKLVTGPKGVRKRMKWFHDHGYGNAGSTSGHLIPDYPRILAKGFRDVHLELDERYQGLSGREKSGPKGAQLRAMMTAAVMPRDLAAKYSQLCWKLAAQEPGPERKAELVQMARNLERVPWEPAETFWEAVQSLWLTHMLVMSDENYPGPGVSFGRVDQYLLPFWEKSLAQGMNRSFGKEVLGCFFIHANTAYDAMIQTGNQGITSAYGQLITLSGLGPEGRDMTNDLTHAFLDVIDDMSPILEPKPNVRLHRGSPDGLLDRVVEMIGSSQGSPFLLNFDERSMAGMLEEARKAGLEGLIRPDNVFDYAPVGCLENTMCGNDRSGTVDANLNLLKAVELALNDGRDFFPFVDPITGKKDPWKHDGPRTGGPETMASFDDFWRAYEAQTRYLIERTIQLYEGSEEVRARFLPTPYVSCLVKGCAEKGLDVTQGGAEIALATIEAGTFATTVDSLLAIEYLVYETGACTLAELKAALMANWEGYEILQAKARNKAPKYGRDDDRADGMAGRVMNFWTQETWKHQTRSTGRKFRPGMLSWNYWVGDGYILPASPDGRPKGRFLSNAICPVTGADTRGPTANANSVGKALGGRANDGRETFEDYVNVLPNGASHTLTFNPSLLRDPEHRDKFKAFLRGYAENGGTALQVNMLRPEMLLDAQKNPQDYRHLLVRVTGYNAYFTSIGRELQDEVIARTCHEGIGG
jgi:formate C-acetyltransferase